MEQAFDGLFFGDDTATEFQPAYTNQSRALPVDLLQNCVVVDKAGEEIGDIEDIMIDLTTGRINYVVLSHGDWLSSKSIAIPWDALSVDIGGACLVLDKDLAQFMDDPGHAEQPGAASADALAP